MAINPRNFLWINLIVFQLGWIAAILGGNLASLIFIVPALCWHFIYSPCKKDDVIAVLICLIFGLFHDGLLLNLNLLVIPHYPIFPPVWLILLWALLGITLNHSLRWIYQRPLLASLLGAIAGPLSYFAGVKLTNAEWSDSLSTIILFLVIAWLILLPLHRFLFLRVRNYAQV